MVAKHRVANVVTEDQEERTTWEITICIFAQWCLLCLHLSSRLDPLQSKELRSRRPACRGVDRRSSVTHNIRVTGAFNPCQYGLTSSQPNGGVKAAHRSAVYTMYGTLCPKRLSYPEDMSLPGPTATTLHGEMR